MKRPKPEPRNGFSRRAIFVAAAGAAVSATASRAGAAEGEVIRLGYLRWTEPRLTISFLDKPPRDDGLAGAKLAAADNTTTARLMGQSFELKDVPLRQDDDPVAAMNDLAGQGFVLIMTDAPGEIVLRLAQQGAGKGVTIFNIAAPDDALREENCRANMIHVAPSRRMLADALAQYLVWKKWHRWLLAYGSHPADKLLADAYRRAAKRFGARIVNEREFKDTGAARQTDSGVTQIQQQMPVFTQNAPDYDVLIAADENYVFADYLPYRTWDPRPVAGSAGLRPVSWDPTSDSWGGAQLQDRFIRMFHRRMTALDMNAWTGARMVGEAATRSQSADPAKIMAYMKGPGFAVAAYKGQALSLRDWDWQLRQPILLSDGRTVVSLSPQPGFLHQVTELDTLGVDRPETKCKL